MPIVAKNKTPAGSRRGLCGAEMVGRSVRLTAEEIGYIQMVVTLWRRCNGCGTAMGVQALRRRALCIFRYRIMRRHLIRDAALSLALGQRPKRRDCRTGGTRRDRRLGFFVAAAEPDIG